MVNLILCIFLLNLFQSKLRISKGITGQYGKNGQYVRNHVEEMALEEEVENAWNQYMEVSNAQ